MNCAYQEIESVMILSLSASGLRTGGTPWSYHTWNSNVLQPKLKRTNRWSLQTQSGSMQHTKDNSSLMLSHQLDIINVLTVSSKVKVSWVMCQDSRIRVPLKSFEHLCTVASKVYSFASFSRNLVIRFFFFFF